uniref:Putative secreted protein n=1 Tax=Xenopsylla cheopis TaxID=163159 RepID=A0A6M2E2T8_XENCH
MDAMSSQLSPFFHIKQIVVWIFIIICLGLDDYVRDGFLENKANREQYADGHYPANKITSDTPFAEICFI